MCNTMSDWIALFKFLELNVGNRTSGESESAPESTRNPTNKRILHELENNQCLNRMMHALAAAQVVGENMTPMETTIYSFLYISPRTTPAGRMLERLYCGINSRAQDPELQCLRVLSQFNDTTDIETGFSDTMSLSCAASTSKTISRGLTCLWKKSFARKKMWYKLSPQK